MSATVDPSARSCKHAIHNLRFWCRRDQIDYPFSDLFPASSDLDSRETKPVVVYSSILDTIIAPEMLRHDVMPFFALSIILRESRRERNRLHAVDHDAQRVYALFERQERTLQVRFAFLLSLVQKR